MVGDEGGGAPASARRSHSGDHHFNNSKRRNEHDDYDGNNAGVKNPSETQTARGAHSPAVEVAAPEVIQDKDEKDDDEDNEDEDEYSSDEPDVDDETGGAHLNESTLPMIETEAEDSNASISSEDE